MKLVWAAVLICAGSCTSLVRGHDAARAAASASPGVPATGPEAPAATDRARARDLGIRIGALPPGRWNAITDVPGVLVGQTTVVRGARIRTGVTVVLPHGGNLFRSKVPAAVAVANGFGKLVGTTQVEELGEIESPIALTNTLNVGKVMDALVGHVLDQPGNEAVRSVNVVVGETNDGRLNDIRRRAVTAEHVAAALAGARGGPVSEGAVGAGTGTVCFGWKGGIGSASRRLTGRSGEEWHVGVLVQTNFGGTLAIAGQAFAGIAAGSSAGAASVTGRPPEDGSCMIVIATDAPLSPPSLRRLARRAFVGMARTGASFSNGSGDYAIAFSTHGSVRTRVGAAAVGGPVWAHGRLTPLFRAVAEATEEAILNSLCAAKTTTGCGRTVPALPLDRVRALIRR